MLLEILRFAQDDKLGYVGANAFYFVRRGRRPRRPATNYIFLAVYARNTFYRVGRGLAPAAGFAVNYGTDKL